MSIDFTGLDVAAMVKIAVAIAVGLGLKELASKLLRGAARAIRTRVKGTPSKADDLGGEVLARFLDLGADAAERGDWEKLAQIITAAAVMPPPKLPVTSAAIPGIPAPRK